MVKTVNLTRITRWHIYDSNVKVLFFCLFVFHSSADILYFEFSKLYNFQQNHQQAPLLSSNLDKRYNIVVPHSYPVYLSQIENNII